MQAMTEQAQKFSGAMAYLAKTAIASKHAPKQIYAQIFDQDAYDEAMAQAHMAAEQLEDMGQQHIIGCMMEAIEAASWMLSPSSDYEDHQAMLHDLFQEMLELELPDADEEPEDGSLAWQKALLENCLAASNG